ncbi:type II toxin-antitoxin system HicA family toxin [bacterium]
MKLPKDINGRKPAGLLSVHGYKITRQTGSHIRLTTTSHGPEHHITIPDHNPLKTGTLSRILRDVAAYLEMDKQALIQALFG